MTPRLPLLCLALLAAPAFAQTGASPAPQGGLQPASPERLFADWDTDKNNQLSLAEFRAGWEAAREANLLGRLEQQFRAADRNKSGFLEPAEYAALPVIQRAGSAAPPFATFDANKNQSLDFKEYLALVQAMIKRNAGGQ